MNYAALQRKSIDNSILLHYIEIDWFSADNVRRRSDALAYGRRNRLYSLTMDEPLDLVQLRSLLAIAECGGFRRAAAALNISQPAVSQHVRALERRLGRPIVVKSGRGVRFTDAGEELVAEARRLFVAHDESLRRLRLSTDPPIVIGSTEHAADIVLPRLLSSLNGAFPDRRVKFRLDRSIRLLDDVRNGRIDIAVIFGDTADRPGTTVGALTLVWLRASSARIPISGPEPVPLVVFDEPCGFRRRALDELALRGIRSEILAEATTLDGVLTATRAGLGVAMLPVARSLPYGLDLVGGLPELGGIDIKLVARHGLDPSVEAVACSVVTAVSATLPSTARIS